MELNKPETVYYYCKPHVFESIIHHKKIWLCDMLKTNDYGEIHFVLDELINHPKNCAIFAKADDTQEECIKRVFAERAEQFLEKYYWLAICFTMVENNLIHWRTYGFNGKGFAIGFKRDELAKMHNPGKLEYRRIKYGNKERKDYIKSKLEDLDKRLKKYTLDTLFQTNGNLKQEVKKIISGWFNSLNIDVAFCKSDDFEYEKEERLCIVKRKGGLLNSIHSIASVSKDIERDCEYGVAFGEQDTIAYRKVDCSNLISKIVIGPRNSATEKDIKCFLAKYGWSGIKVEKSEITYRS